MNLRVLLTLTTLAFGSVAIAVADDAYVKAPPDTYQIAYASNINVGDSYINITNAGTRGGYDTAQTGFGAFGGICANVYVFDPSEEMIACCSCYVSPDGLRSLSVQNDLVIKTLTPAKPNGIVIKLLASTLNTSGACDASTPKASELESGMRAWSTTLHLNTTTSQTALTENAFQQEILSASEFQKLTTFCAFIKAIGSTYGICNSCQLGGTLSGTIR